VPLILQTSVDAARIKVNILCRALTFCKVGIDINAQIHTLQVEHSTEFLIPETTAECNREIRLTQSRVKKIARDSFKTRIQELKDMMTDLYLSSSTGDNKDNLKILKHIKKAEEIKRMFRNFGYVRREKGQTVVNVLEVPKDPADNPKELERGDHTKWRTVKVPAEIETLLTNWSRKHFGHVAGPWLSPPLSQQVDFEASSITSELILQGEYNASDLDEITQFMTHHLVLCDISGGP
jgi:hypothetical protein